MSLGVKQTAYILSQTRFTGLDNTLALHLGAGVLLLSLHCYIALKTLKRVRVTTNVSNSGTAWPPSSKAVDDAKKQDIHVSKLFIHPIKSCRGISVKEVKYTQEGLENDRQWSIADAKTNAILTAHKHSRLILVSPSIQLDSSSPYGGMLVVSFPEDSDCETLRIPLRPDQKLLEKWQVIDNAKLWSSNDINCYVCEALSPIEPSPSVVLSKYIGKPVSLVFKGPRTRHCGPTPMFPELDASLWFQDGYPLLVLSEECVNVIEQEVQKYVGQQGIDERWKEKKIPVERYRPNIVFSGAGAFAEDNWKEISINSSSELPSLESTFSIVSLCVRCLMPNIDTETGVRDCAVPYKVLMKFRSGLKPGERFKPCAGCNAVPRGSGILRVGDKVTVRQLVKEN